jgi:ATPase inhibitor, mitochondrial
MSLRLVTRSLPRTQSIRTFTMSALRAAEGDTGAPRSGGQAQSDAFTKREQASEDYYVRQQEKEKLEALRKKIADQEESIAKDRKEVEELSKKQG